MLKSDKIKIFIIIVHVDFLPHFCCTGGHGTACGGCCSAADQDCWIWGSTRPFGPRVFRNHNLFLHVWRAEPLAFPLVDHFIVDRMMRIVEGSGREVFFSHTLPLTILILLIWTRCFFGGSLWKLVFTYTFLQRISTKNPLQETFWIEASSDYIRIRIRCYWQVQVVITS